MVLEVAGRVVSAGGAVREAAAAAGAGTVAAAGGAGGEAAAGGRVVVLVADRRRSRPRATGGGELHDAGLAVDHVTTVDQHRGHINGYILGQLDAPSPVLVVKDRGTLVVLKVPKGTTKLKEHIKKRDIHLTDYHYRDSSILHRCASEAADGSALSTPKR